MSPDEREGRGWQYLGVGCLTTVAGFFGGGMIGVFIGWIVGHVTGCRPAPDAFPICNFFPYWIAGMFGGALLVPTVAITRLRRSDRRTDPVSHKEDGGGPR